MSIPTEHDIKQELRACGAGGFSLDEAEGGRFLFSCRDNGDVGEETPGQEDIQAARTAARHLREKYPEAEVSFETVDEWVHIDVNFAKARAEKETAVRNDIREAACSTVMQALVKMGFPVEVKTDLPTNRDARARITSTAMFIEKDTFGDHEQANSLEIWVIVTNDKKPKLTLQAWHSEASIQTSGNSKDIGQETEDVFASLIEKLKKGRVGIEAALWKTIPYPTDVPEGAVKIGTNGYDGPWENAPYYRLPDQSVIHIDGENKQSFLIPAENAQRAIRLLGDFFPEVPENSTGLNTLMREIMDKLTAQVKEEALRGETTTLARFGKAGTPIIAADGSIHFTAAEPSAEVESPIDLNGEWRVVNDHQITGNFIPAIVDKNNTPLFSAHTYPGVLERIVTDHNKLS